MMLKNSLIRGKGSVNCFRVAQRRHFQKIVISNPIGVKLLGWSKVVLKGIGIFYASAAVIGTTGYFTGQWYLEPYQHISKDWPLLATIHSRFAVFHQDIVEDETKANHLLIKTLRQIGSDEGVVLEGEDSANESKFKLLNLEQLQNKSIDWQSSYLDIVMRLAKAKIDIEDFTNAKKLVNYAINVPMNIGSFQLKSMVLRFASRFSLNDGDQLKAESYLLDSIRVNEFYETGIQFKSHDSYLLTNTSHLNQETFNSLVDLGVLYTKMEDYTKSLEIFLNLLKVLDDNNFEFVAQGADKPMLKNYIGEILYKKDMLKRSIDWCNESFKESYQNSKNDPKSAKVAKQALTNLIALYSKNGDYDLKQEAELKLQEIDITFPKSTGWNLFSVLFS